MYTKLFAKVLDSSIWLEPNPTRIAWITMLAAMDEDGFCQFASIKNLAMRAVISPEEARKAVETFESPDPDSSDPDFGGRRAERVPGGWMILNAKKYSDLAKREHMKKQNRDRVSAYRSRNAPVIVGNDSVMPLDVDVDLDLRKPTPTPVAKVEIATPAKPKRRSKASILSAYSSQTRAACDGILKDWPAKQPDGSPIRLDTADFMLRVDALLQTPELTPEILIDSARRYLAEKKKFRRAPQYFFGAGNGEGAHWLQYARMAKYEEAQEEADRDFSLSAPGPAVSTPMSEIRSGEVRPERGKD